MTPPTPPAKDPGGSGRWQHLLSHGSLPPSLVVDGRWREGEEASRTGTRIPDIRNSSLGMGGGLALLVPLGGTGFKQACSGLLQLQHNRAKLALAQQLLEAGQITDEDMKRVVDGMRRSLGLN
jgi:hypothetical protein